MVSSSASIPLKHLPLRQSTLTTLQRNGFVTVGELEKSIDHGGMEQLAADLNVSLADAADLFQQVQSCLVIPTATCSSLSASQDDSSNGFDFFGGITAQELLAKSNDKRNRSIVSFCKSIDDMLGGGIALGQVTEISGMPGTGKTQLAMQLCVDASIPTKFAGVNGQAVYIDTEGSFSPQRCYTMACALVHHIHSSIQRRHRRRLQQQQQQSHTTTTTPVLALPQLPGNFTPEQILSGIHVYRVHSEEEQDATIRALPDFLIKQRDTSNVPPVKLIIIDSLAFHYRSANPGIDNKKSSLGNRRNNQLNSRNANSYYFERSKKLTTLAANLSEMATTYDLAIVAINHMTTKFGSSPTSGNTISTSSALSKFDSSNDGDLTAEIVPALGESWAHATHTRLQLSSSIPSQLSISTSEIKRICTLIKSPHQPAGTALFQIMQEGIRGASVDDGRRGAESARIEQVTDQHRQDEQHNRQNIPRHVENGNQVQRQQSHAQNDEQQEWMVNSSARSTNENVDPTTQPSTLGGQDFVAADQSKRARIH